MSEDMLENRDREDIIEKRKLSYQVSKYIREMIVNNEIKGGERIVETKIAKQLGVSQTPVREALRELEAMGFVEIKPYLGCFVRQISIKEIKQAYQIRSALESFAVTVAFDNMGEELANKLSKIRERMEHAASINDGDMITICDSELHESIIKAADNNLLEKIWNMTNVSQWILVKIRSSDNPIGYYINMHDPIIDSLTAGNRELLKKAIEQHYASCLELIERGSQS